jgi:hypothetical protein
LSPPTFPVLAISPSLWHPHIPPPFVLELYIIVLPFLLSSCRSKNFDPLPLVKLGRSRLLSTRSPGHSHFSISAVTRHKSRRQSHSRNAAVQLALQFGSCEIWPAAKHIPRRGPMSEAGIVKQNRCQNKYSFKLPHPQSNVKSRYVRFLKMTACS